MAELIILKPLFAGTDHIDQLTKIFDVVGTPNDRTLDEVCEPCKSFENLRLKSNRNRSFRRSRIHQQIESETETRLSKIVRL